MQSIYSCIINALCLLHFLETLITISLVNNLVRYFSMERFQLSTFCLQKTEKKICCIRKVHSQKCAQTKLQSTFTHVLNQRILELVSNVFYPKIL